MSQEFLMSIEDNVFTAVFSFLNGLISAATGGIITDYLGGASTPEDLVNGMLENLGTAVTDWTNDLASQVTTLTTDAMTKVNEQFLKSLGITDLQDKILKNLDTTMNERVDSFTDKLTADLDREETAASALAEQAGKFLGHDAEKSVMRAEQYMTDLKSRIDWENTGVMDQTIANFDYMSLDLSEKLESLGRLGELASTDAINGALELAEVQMDSYNVWFKDTVAVPVAEAENMERAILDALSIDIEALPDELRKVIGLVLNSAVGFDYSEVIRKAGEATHGGE